MPNVAGVSTLSRYLRQGYLRLLYPLLGRYNWFGLCNTKGAKRLAATVPFYFDSHPHEVRWVMEEDDFDVSL